MIKRETYTQETLPSKIYFVDDKRVRSGKGVMVVEPVEWVFGGVCVEGSSPYSVKNKKEHYYSLRDCFETLNEAEEEIEKIASNILAYENRKLDDLRRRLRKSIKTTKQG